MAEKFNIFSRGATANITAFDWCNIDSNFAGNVFNKPTRLQTRSDTSDNYDGTLAAKCLVMFSTPLDKTKQYELLFWDGFAALPGVRDYLNWDWDVVGTHSLTTVTKLRYRYITAPYSLTTLNWNNYIAGPPSLYVSSSAFDINTWGFSTNAGLVNNISERKYWLPPIRLGTLPTDASVYGFLFDSKIVVSLTNGTTAVMNHTISVPVPTVGPSSTPRLYAIGT